MRYLCYRSIKLMPLLLCCIYSYNTLGQACSTGSNLVYNSVWHSKSACPGIMQLNIKTHFGAVGNGSTLDHAAFKAAAAFINARQGGVDLFIPAGTYIVGNQFAGVYTQDNTN